MSNRNPLFDTGRIRFGGMTLIELLVGLAIGSFLLLGAVTVFMQGRQTFRVNETVSRLQENARFVLDAIEPDIRMAHYFGLTTRSGKISNRRQQTQSHDLGPDTCANNWAIDFDNAVEGSNNSYPWASCTAFGDGAQAGSDTLTIRRVQESPTASGALAAGTMYIQSWRLQPGQIFIGTGAPSSDPTSAIHEIVVNGYYVSQDSALSTAGNSVPSLRTKTLTTQGGAPAVADREVLPGVEDFQVQLGVDTDPEGAPTGRGVVDRFVNPDNAIVTPNVPILAVRIWVRVRSELPEIGYENTNTYAYAGESFTANDNFRRVVVSKTIYLRNTRPAS